LGIYTGGMSSEEIRQLCARARGGSQAAREKLVKAHAGLVAHIAKCFYHPGAFLEWEDLVQQGCLGLLRAIEKFNPRQRSRGRAVRFTTYAHYWIFHCISREIENHGRTVAVPLPQLKKLKVGSTQYSLVPLDGEWLEDENGVARIRCIALDDSSEDWGLAWDARRRVERLLKTLSQRKRAVLQYRYGLEQPEILTQAQAGKILQVSGTRVGILERAALRQLRSAVSL
jgi:RNA polymerase sigma factor (sigma-70 family)